MNSFWFLCQFGPLSLVFFHLWDLSSILSWLVQIPNTVQFQVNIATSKCIFFYAGVMSLTIKICKFFLSFVKYEIFFFKSIVVVFIIAMHTCMFSAKDLKISRSSRHINHYFCPECSKGTNSSNLVLTFVDT